jgi:hypothetical protein
VLFTNFNVKPWHNKKVIQWDVTSYYGYLPACFVHGDLSLDFIDGNRAYYANNHMFWPERTAQGDKVIKTTMGLSWLYMPFFAIGHIEAGSKDQKQDGFSVAYHKWIHLSAFFYLVVGLFFLHAFLKKYFSFQIASIVVVSIVLGTNLFYYATTEAAMSHVYNFALISVFLWLMPGWLSAPNFRNSLFLGVVSGLIVLIRPTNLIVLLMLLLFPINNRINFKQRLYNLFVGKLKYLLVALLAAFLVWVPQLLYWKFVTGDWLFYSYSDEQFYFLNSHVWEFLFSYRKGWLLYTPLMFLAFGGLLILLVKRRGWGIAITVPIALYIFVHASWWCWWFGGSFGLRAMIDIYPIMAIPLATFVSWVISRRSLRMKQFAGGVLIALICLNLFQTFQYRRGVIHWDSMTKEAYWKGFGRIQVDRDKFNRHYRQPDYESARKGMNENR